MKSNMKQAQANRQIALDSISLRTENGENSLIQEIIESIANTLFIIYKETYIMKIIKRNKKSPRGLSPCLGVLMKSG